MVLLYSEVLIGPSSRGKVYNYLSEGTLKIKTTQNLLLIIFYSFSYLSNASKDSVSLKSFRFYSYSFFVARVCPKNVLTIFQKYLVYSPQTSRNVATNVPA